MSLVGPLKKLVATFKNPIEYCIPIGNDALPLNPLLGRKISLNFLQEIYCIQCQRKTSKSFQQGYCFPCYKKLLDCNLCIIHPERCQHPMKDCPDTWEHAHCKQDHIVYLANSSGLKVGITRHTQVPTRWIDQGAIQAIPLFKVRNRYHSGLIEVALKKYLADKTNWRKMLSPSVNPLDMTLARQELLLRAKPEIEPILATHADIVLLEEPEVILNYPHKSAVSLKAVSLDKEGKVEGILRGIKGQYLLLENCVINIRKHSGYKVAFEVE